VSGAALEMSRKMGWSTARSTISFGAIAMCAAFMIWLVVHDQEQGAVRLLEWDKVNGVERFIIDGNECGVGDEGMKAVRTEVGHHDSLRVVARGGMKVTFEPWDLPDELLMHWLQDGVGIEFRHEEKWLRAHYLTWKGLDPVGGESETEYILDGRWLGKDGEGLRELQRTPLQPNSIVFLIDPLVPGPSSVEVFPDGLNRAFKRWLEMYGGKDGGMLYVFR